VRGGSNLQFQVPSVSHPSVIYNDQGGIDSETNNGCIDVANMANAAFDKYSIEKQSYCIGEDIASLRQLITKFILMKWNYFGVLNNYPTVYISPFVWPATYYIKSGSTYAPSAVASFYSDIISTFANCFLFWRGGMRFAISETNGTSKTYIATNVSMNNGSTTFSSDYERNSGTGAQIYTDGYYTTENSNLSIVRIPYYNRFPLSVVRPLWSNTQSHDNRYGPSHVLSIAGPSTGPNYSSNYLSVQRAIAEDFQFSFFLSVPTVYLP